MTSPVARSDHELKTFITAELQWTAAVDGDHIGVAVTDGAVTLSGQVATFPEKEAALAAGLRVRGVVAIVDEIFVKNDWDAYQDADIARQAVSALKASVIVPETVHAVVHSHVVTLSGTVTWQYQREAAYEAVKSLTGVSHIRNAIIIAPTVAVSPNEARSQITAALVRNARLDAKHVRVDVTGTTVVLTGTVSSWSEHRQAERGAWSASGVTHVDNQMTVVF